MSSKKINKWPTSTSKDVQQHWPSEKRKSKATMRDHVTPARGAGIKETENVRRGDGEKPAPPHAAVEMRRPQKADRQLRKVRQRAGRRMAQGWCSPRQRGPLWLPFLKQVGRSQITLLRTSAPVPRHLMACRPSLPPVPGTRSLMW